jgi:hypothetical protein
VAKILPSSDRTTKEQAMSLSTSVPLPTYDPAAQAAMAWYGWGSPVGLAIALVGVGLAAILVRFAVLGF